MKSIVSYPKRGKWGKSNYRGNCSGYIIQDLIDQFHPKSFADITMGSGTSKEVCLENGIKYVGLDLHTGFDFTKNSLAKVLNNPFDMVFSHLPYFDMIDYTEQRNLHGLSGTGNDISQFTCPDAFIEASFLALMNQREGTKSNGIYSTLIGDYRKNGKFYSFQSDFIKFMPKDELISVVIKAQHNCVSDRNSYKGSFIPINHEYLLIWKKKNKSYYQVCYDKASQLKEGIKSTWRTLIRMVMMEFNGPIKLETIYSRVLQVAPQKIQGNPNYKAKIRQTLQLYCTHVERGVWAA